MIEKNQNLLVAIILYKEFDIATNSICKIVNQDLMGTIGISLIIGEAISVFDLDNLILLKYSFSCSIELSVSLIILKLYFVKSNLLRRNQINSCLISSNLLKP